MIKIRVLSKIKVKGFQHHFNSKSKKEALSKFLLTSSCKLRILDIL